MPIVAEWVPTGDIPIVSAIGGNRHCALGVDHDILGAEVLMQHIFAMKCVKLTGDLFYDTANCLDTGFEIIGHPLAKGLAFDKFGDRVKRRAFFV